MIHFIGAGPGAPDLLTLRGRDLIAECAVCMYAGSLVPPEILRFAPSGARMIDTAEMTLPAIVAEMARAHERAEDVARLHSGDLSIWSAMAEQMRRLQDLGIPYDVTPGVPAFGAAAAALGQELTVPGVSQTVILTRTATRSTPMPPGEELTSLARTGALLAIHLSIANIAQVVADLLPFYGEDCPAAVVFRASWPQEIIVRASLGNLESEIARSAIDRTAIIFVGRSLVPDATGIRESYLYSRERERTT